MLRQAAPVAGVELDLQLDLMQLGTSAEAVISASGLIVKAYACYYGHDPEPLVRQSRSRRGMIDGWMRARAEAQQ
jgi:hypothetical protein